MTARWATHKSNQKRLVTENRANSHRCIVFIILLHLSSVCYFDKVAYTSGDFPESMSVTAVCPAVICGLCQT